MTVYKYFIFENVTLEIYSCMSTFSGNRGLYVGYVLLSPLCYIPLSEASQCDIVMFNLRMYVFDFAVCKQGPVRGGLLCYWVSFEMGIFVPRILADLLVFQRLSAWR